LTVVLDVESWHSASRTDLRWHLGRYGVRIGWTGRGSAPAAEIDPRRGGGKASLVRGAGSGQSGTAASPGGSALRSPSLRPAGIQRHAPQVSHSSQWHSGTLSCELRARRFVSTRSIRCRSPSMRGHGQRLIGHDGRQYPPVPGGQRPSGAAKPAPGMRSFWRWSGCRMQPPGGGAKPRSDRPAC